MRTELLLSQDKTVCIRVKEVQVCCNRWLKREMAFVLLQDGSLFLSDLRKLDFGHRRAVTQRTHMAAKDAALVPALLYGP